MCIFYLKRHYPKIPKNWVKTKQNRIKNPNWFDKSNRRIHVFLNVRLDLFSVCRIFVNRSLTLENIKCYGFDMDYTLAGEWGDQKHHQTLTVTCASPFLPFRLQPISLLTMKAWALSWSETEWCPLDTRTRFCDTPMTPASPLGTCLCKLFNNLHCFSSLLAPKIITFFITFVFFS